MSRTGGGWIGKMSDRASAAIALNQIRNRSGELVHAMDKTAVSFVLLVCSIFNVVYIWNNCWGVHETYSEYIYDCEYDTNLKLFAGMISLKLFLCRDLLTMSY